MTATELQPLRPHQSSAGTVRHHRKCLTYRLREVAPGACVVRATPVLAGDEWAFVVLALDAQRQAIRLQACERDGQRISGHQRISELLRGAFPAEDWGRTQVWRADRPDVIAEYKPAVPAVLRKRKSRPCAVCELPCPPGWGYCSWACRNLDDPHGDSDDYEEDRDV